LLILKLKGYVVDDTVLVKSNISDLALIELRGFPGFGPIVDSNVNLTVLGPSVLVKVEKVIGIVEYKL
jgi:hypothetical protein